MRGREREKQREREARGRERERALQKDAVVEGKDLEHSRITLDDLPAQCGRVSLSASHTPGRAAGVGQQT